MFKATGLFEGDIMSVSKKGLLNTYPNKWTSGIVYYVIDNNSYSKLHISSIFKYLKTPINECESADSPVF